MGESSGGEGAADASSSGGRAARAVMAPAAWAILPDDAGMVRDALDRAPDAPTQSEPRRVFDLWPMRSDETAAWTFGLEFEFASADAAWVAAELHARGLVASPEPVEYHAPRLPGMWSVEHDSTVTTVFADVGAAIAIGGEVVSPPMVDSVEAWQQVAAVLEVLRACGAEVTGQCGFHVHFGAQALRDASDDGTTDHEAAQRFVRRVTRLAVLANACFEDVLFRMASAEGGRHRGRPFFYRHSRPLERPLGRHYASVEDLAQSLGKPGAPRRAALNLTNVGSTDKDTVEFRQCNGTLDVRVVQGFVRLCALLVGAARWVPEAVQAPPQPLGSHLAAERDGMAVPTEGALWRMLAVTNPEGMPREAASSLLWLFRRGSWQPGLADLAGAW